MHARSLLAIVAVATLAGVARAQVAQAPVTGPAQSSSSDDDIPGSGFALPISGRNFTIGASVRTLYDTNIRRRGDGLSSDDGSAKADFRFTPTASIEGGFPVGRQQLFVSGDVGRDIYARNERSNSNRYTLGVGAALVAGRSCSGNINADVRRRQSLFIEDSGQTNNIQENQSFSAAIDCAPSAGIGFGGGVSHRSTDNKTEERASNDSRTTSFDARLNFGAPALGIFSAGGTYSRIVYPRRDVLVEASDGGIDQVEDRLNSYSANVGYSRSLGSRLSVSASASYIKTKPDPRDTLSVIVLPDIGPVLLAGPREGYSGPGFNLALNYRPGVRLTATLNASRNATGTSNVSARIVVRDNVSATVTYNLGPSIITALGASYDRRSYKGEFTSEADPVARVRDTSGRVFARASYSPRALYGVDFELAHQKRDSNPSIYNFSSTAATLTLRAKFGRG